MKNLPTPSESVTKISYGDKRIGKRLAMFVKDMTAKLQSSILGASGTRRQAQGAYRLLANERFELAKMQGSVSQTTVQSIIDNGCETVLLVQDTTEINLNTHKKTEGLGYCSDGTKGIRTHSCIAETTDGVTLGLMAQQFETRAENKDETKASEKSKRPIEEKESFRWLETMRAATALMPAGVAAITVCDRECDFYEFYNEAHNLEEKYIVRVVANRVADDGEKLKTKLRSSDVLGKVVADIPRDTRNSRPARKAMLEVTFAEATLIKPRIRTEANINGKLAMKFVRIHEPEPPKGIAPIEWILATNLPLMNAGDALKVVQYYVQRWKIERFHFVLKSGCKAEEIQQRSVAAIEKVLAVYSVIAIYIMTLMLLGRQQPDLTCDAFFAEDEWKILYCVARRTQTAPQQPYSAKNALDYLGRLGGYERAPSDGEIGVRAIWQGLFALWLISDAAPFVRQV